VRSVNYQELRLALRPLTFLDSQVADPSGMVELRARPQRRLLVWRPDLVEEIFRSDARMRHRPSSTLGPMLGHRSLLWIEGQRHTAYRRALGPQLRGRRLAGYHDLIRSSVSAAIDALPAGGEITVAKWTRQVTLDIIGRILFGQIDGEILTEFTEWIERALGSRARTLRYRYLGGGLPSSGQQLDARLLHAAKIAAVRYPETLAGLLSEQDGPLGHLDEGELRDQLVSLLFAGHETTASATAWTLYWLDRDTAVRGELLDELDGTTSDGADPATVPLLHAVAQESLRLSPPATLAGNRVTTPEGALRTEPLADGTIVTPSIYLAHRNQENFPAPQRFDPHRFLRGRVSTPHYFPFGGGVRKCLGSELAMLEIRMITAAVLRRRELRSVNPMAGTPQLRGPAMAPSDRLRMEVISCRD
jgi:cytochrome P450